jgi:exonuclease V gamma subunit
MIRKTFTDPEPLLKALEKEKEAKRGNQLTFGAQQNENRVESVFKPWYNNDNETLAQGEYSNTGLRHGRNVIIRPGV